MWSRTGGWRARHRRVIHRSPRRIREDLDRGTNGAPLLPRRPRYPYDQGHLALRPVTAGNRTRCVNRRSSVLCLIRTKSQRLSARRGAAILRMRMRLPIGSSGKLRRHISSNHKRREVSPQDHAHRTAALTKGDLHGFNIVATDNPLTAWMKFRLEEGTATSTVIGPQDHTAPRGIAETPPAADYPRKASRRSNAGVGFANDTRVAYLPPAMVQFQVKTYRIETQGNPQQ